eukprot:TRINITY_DN78033_c0_g1_i1.p1 TRINITY_DN78033_c0_g1~~TRINITY_DN78033_c0_g1_i1.p1  ORF type:complete len:107 (-),score=18.63 TRINITY_DN78033_c0_g1_i1:260-580(-)
MLRRFLFPKNGLIWRATNCRFMSTNGSAPQSQKPNQANVDEDIYEEPMSFDEEIEEEFEKESASVLYKEMQEKYRRNPGFASRYKRRLEGEPVAPTPFPGKTFPPR